MDETGINAGDGSDQGSRAQGTEASAARFVDRFSFFRAQSPVPVYVGIALVISGFSVIGFVWGKVAALTNVALQVPYLVSGGLTGLGCIMVGITVISLSSKRREHALTTRELRELREVVRELRDALIDEEDKW